MTTRRFLLFPWEIWRQTDRMLPVNGFGFPYGHGRAVSGQDPAGRVVAGVSMLVLLLFGTGFVGYLPVPVLTAIVISALLGATEFHLAVRLWKISRTE